MRTRTATSAAAVMLFLLSACGNTEDAATPGTENSMDTTADVDTRPEDPGACDAWTDDLMNRDLQDECMAEQGERVYTPEERAGWASALRDIDPGLVAEKGSGYDSLEMAERDIIYRGIDTCSHIAQHRDGGATEQELLDRVAAQYYIDYQQISTELARPVVDAAEQHICPAQ